MNFQNISIHGSNAMHMKAKRSNSQKLQRAITPTKFIKLAENLIRRFSPQSQSVYQISRL